MATTYNPNIPQPTNRPSDSQGQILLNFQTLDTVFAVDHVQFSLTTNFGKHKQVTFDTNHPAAAPAGTESVLYTRNVGAAPALFWRNSVSEQPISPNAGGGAAFAWCSFNVAGAISANYNVGGVIPLGGNDYQINFSNPLAVASVTGFLSGREVFGNLLTGYITGSNVAFVTVRCSAVVGTANFVIFGS